MHYHFHTKELNSALRFYERKIGEQKMTLIDLHVNKRTLLNYHKQHFIRVGQKRITVTQLAELTVGYSWWSKAVCVCVCVLTRVTQMITATRRDL